MQSQCHCDKVKYVCDIDGCERKPYMEMYDLKSHSWIYLCRWHYYLDRLKRNKYHGYAKADSIYQMMDTIRNNIERMQYDIEEINEKIGEE